MKDPQFAQMVLAMTREVPILFVHSYRKEYRSNEVGTESIRESPDHASSKNTKVGTIL
jgi:hypothetical protein